jgi:nicotinamidase-related amidase
MRHQNILNRSDALLLIIDVQEAFRKFIPDFDAMTKNIVTLIEAAKILGLPPLVTEQYPKGLGKTVDEISSKLGPHEVFEKDCFSCCGSDAFSSALKKSGRNKIIVVGIEAHVCVNQTVHDLILAGYQPHLIIDAISSRYPHNKEIALKKMIAAGAVPSTMEMALFELLVNSGTDEFKAVQRLVK